MRRVGPREAHTLLTDEGYAYLDVRSVPEFEAGHPAGAYNVPLAHADGVPNPNFVAAVLRHFDLDRGLVVGCELGGRSMQAAALLLEAGFANVVDQRAGWSGARDPFGRVTETGWERTGLPSATCAERGRSWAELDVTP